MDNQAFRRRIDVKARYGGFEGAPAFFCGTDAAVTWRRFRSKCPEVQVPTTKVYKPVLWNQF